MFAWLFLMAAAPPAADVLWLDRLTYGIDTATVARVEKLGKKAWLDEQLAGKAGALPADVEAALARLEVASLDPGAELVRISTESQRINGLESDDEKATAKKALGDRANRLAHEAAEGVVLRAIYSPNQLQEQMVWFWLNHFSVFQDKANLKSLVGDYEERAIRPHALGRFSDLVLATVMHPAMLQYLDNAQNAAGHINENYARELMELHTLGVDGGYTQSDVQELAAILTGLGIDQKGTPPKLKPELRAQYRSERGFEWNPARHDSRPKTLLGHAIAGSGFHEVEEAVELLTSQPACARFISRKLALFFMGQEASKALVDGMSRVFLRSRGDITAVLRELFASPEWSASLGRQLKDPLHFVVSTMRLAYDGKIIANTHPVLNWLTALGEAPFGRLTPDGYPLVDMRWASSGQMSKRFEIARAVGSANAGLFEPEDGSAPSTTGFPRLASRLYFDAVEPRLSAQTRAALERATNQQEWNTFLLASPELNSR